MIGFKNKIGIITENLPKIYAKGYEDGLKTSSSTNVAETNGGTFNLETSLGNGGVLEIEHGLSGTPDVVVLSSDILDVAPPSVAGYFIGFANYDKDADTSTYTVYYNGNLTTRSTQSLSNRSDGIVGADDSKFTIKTAGNRQLSKGVTYFWMVLRWNK